MAREFPVLSVIGVIVGGVVVAIGAIFGRTEAIGAGVAIALFSIVLG